MNSLKFRLFWFLFLAAFLAARGVEAAPTWAQNYGVGTYLSDGHPSQDPFYGSGVDYPRAIAAMTDGGFVVAGPVAFPFLTLRSGNGGNSDGVLVRFAADGTILWQTELRQTNDRFSSGGYFPALSYIAQMKVDGQGNIFVAGGKGNSFNSGQVPFVAKFSPAGELIWQNGIPTAGGTVPGTPPQPYETGLGANGIQMGLTLDGGAVITANQTRPNSGYSEPVMAKFDANGAVSFYQAYENPDQYAPNGPIAQSADGTSYVTAIGHLLPSEQAYGLYVSVVDASSGSIISQRAWPSPDGSRETAVSLIRMADGGFACLSLKDDSAGLILRKFNADASAVTLERLITSAAGVPRFYVGSMSQNADTGSFVQTADGGFLIGGHTQNYSNGFEEDAAVMKLHADGTVEFFSLIGGVHSEGNFNGSLSGSVATILSDGGYGFAVSSSTYVTQPAGEDFRQKPDWWVVKTDDARHVRNFNGNMSEFAPSSFNVSASSPQAPIALSFYSIPTYTAGALASDLPTFQMQDPGTLPPPDQPSLTIQAGPPRIISSNKAEAIVDQHFAYNIVTAFFPAGSGLTYGAIGLPQDFTIDVQSGLISGIAHEGSQTMAPIPITIQATDGVETATATLNLTINDGAPTLTVNGNVTPVPSVNDTVLAFVAKQTGKTAGRVMRLQATSDPANPNSWQSLANDTDGFMPYDIDSRSYLLNSTDYPTAGAVYFRTRLHSPGRADLYSNVVGPFDLTTTKTRIGKTTLYISRNGLVANIRFGVTEQNLPPGIVVKIQTSNTPAAEGTWADVPNGTLAQDSLAPHEFYLGFDDYPSSSGNYFRAVATVPGDPNYVPSISAPQGPFAFVNDPAATITLTVPHSGSNDGTDFDNPIVPESNSFNVTTDAVSGRLLQRLSLIYDGDTLESFGPGAIHGSTLYTTSVAGDHLIESTAVDDLFIVGYAKPVHVRIAPPAPGRIYYLVQEGNWNDPSKWINSLGNNGVPGPDDFAVLGSVNVHLTQATQVKALSLNGGTMDGAKLTVTGFCTVGDGRIANDVDIADGATLLFINDADVGLGATVTNFGRTKIHGQGGITFIPALGAAGAKGRFADRGEGLGNLFGRFVNWVKTTFHPPAGGRSGSKAAPTPTPTPGPIVTAKPEVRAVTLASVLNKAKVEVKTDADGLITNDGGSLITNDGGSLIGNDGAGLVDANGHQIVAQGGGNIVAQGAGNIVAQGGGNIVAQGGGNIVAQGGGNAIAAAGNKIVATGGGNIVAQGAGNIISTNGGSIVPPGGRSENAVAREGAAPIDYAQDDGGETDMTGLTIIGPMNLSGGIVTGTGSIIGNVTNTAAFVAPGNGGGPFAITGDYTQMSNGHLILGNAGGNEKQFAQLQVGTTANLAGALQFHTLSGYVPLPEDPINPIGYTAMTGGFEFASSNGQITENPSGTLVVLETSATPAFTFNGAVSRKTHGSSGAFDIPLPTIGQSGVECRNSNGQHSIVFSFSNNISYAGADISSGNANLDGAPVISGNSITVNLSGVADQQEITVSLKSVVDEFGQFLPETSVAMAILVGDTTGNRSVGSSDISQTKAQSGLAVTTASFRNDVNVSGTISASDISQLKANSGHTLSP